MDRCTGHCCRRFTIDLDSLTDPSLSIQDGDFIRDMVVLIEEDEDGKHWFTCRHFDGKDCTAYEDRPAMCVNYPYGRSCNYVDCTWDEVSSSA